MLRGTRYRRAIAMGTGPKLEILFDVIEAISDYCEDGRLCSLFR